MHQLWENVMRLKHSVNIQIKGTDQYFPAMVLIMLYNVVFYEDSYKSFGRSYEENDQLQTFFLSDVKLKTKNTFERFTGTFQKLRQ